MKSMLLFFFSFSFSNILIAQTISFEAPQKYPEGIVWDNASKQFFVSSVIDGSIGTVSIDGKYKIFYADSSLKSTFGMKVDPKNNILWVCSGDPNYSRKSTPETFKKTAHLLGIDIRSGQKKFDINLAAGDTAKHFPNDLTIDPQGNLYITDSYSPVIYKVDATGKTSVLVRNDLFKGMDVALNGIVYHPEGFLLVSHNSSGSLLKADIASGNVSKVKINQFFPGADGLLLAPSGELYLVQNKGVDKIFRLTSMDKWTSATVTGATSVEDRFQNPTTCTWKDGKLMVLNAKLNEINDPSKTKSSEFSIQAANFK